MGYLGTSNPEQLLTTFVFSVWKGFALCVKKEHRALHSIPFNLQFRFLHDTNNEIYLRYAEDVGLKTNKGED